MWTIDGKLHLDPDVRARQWASKRRFCKQIGWCGVSGWGTWEYRRLVALTARWSSPWSGMSPWGVRGTEKPFSSNTPSLSLSLAMLCWEQPLCVHNRRLQNPKSVHQMLICVGSSARSPGILQSINAYLFLWECTYSKNYIIRHRMFWDLVSPLNDIVQTIFLSHRHLSTTVFRSEQLSCTGVP